MHRPQQNASSARDGSKDAEKAGKTSLKNQDFLDKQRTKSAGIDEESEKMKKFLVGLVQRTRGRDTDNYATHKHPVVQDWLAKHPRFTMHFTPTSASWLNMVERFFRDITTERLRRGVFTSVPELIGAIDDYIDHHNTKPKPFIWTKSARDILQKVIRANSRLSSKQNATLH